MPSEPLPSTITHKCHTKPLTKQKAYHEPLLSTKFFNIGKNTTFQLSTFLSDPHSSGLKSESTITLSGLGIITDEPTLEEVTYAVKKLRNGHATGLDSLHCMPGTLHHIHSITPGLMKCAMNPVSSAVYNLFTEVWRSSHVRNVPTVWRDNIISLYKENGPTDNSVVGSWEGLPTSSWHTSNPSC